MTHNDVIRGVRYLMNVSDAVLLEIFQLGDVELSPDELGSFLKRDDEEGYVPCGSQIMARFLNGLIVYKRGLDESRPPAPLEIPVTNNTVMKKLRVAFELKDTDVIALIEKNGLKISKTELSSFCRAPGHRNFRECGDQYLRSLLKGMSL